MKKAALVVIPLIFLAQSCNLGFLNPFGTGTTGSRGIFLSVDSGESWEAKNQALNKTNISGITVRDIFIDPSNPTIMLLASPNGGVYGSQSQGDEWFRLLPNFSAYNVFINPRKSDEIFAAGMKGSAATIVKSTDGGGVWTETFTDPTGQSAVSAMTSDSSGGTIYAGLTTGTMIRSTDTGMTWTKVADFRDRILKLVISRDGRRVYALGRTGGIRVSSDGGSSWTDLPVKGTDESVGQYNDFTFDPRNDGTIYVAGQGGLFRSFNSGASWSRIPLPVAPKSPEIFAVAVSPDNSRQIFASIESVFYRSNDGGVTWRTVNLPTGQTISVIKADPTEPNRIYVGFK